MIKNKKSKHGFAVIIILIALMSLVLVITFSLSVVIITKNKISKNMILSAQSYYSAESGIEDGILRVINSEYDYVIGTNDFNLDGSVVSQNITQNGSTTTIESLSSHFNNERKIKTELTLTTTNVQFHYGVQVGTGGVEMAKTGSVIHGNIYSNGPVIEVANGNATVTENVIVAGANILDDIKVDGDAYANNIIDSEIGGDAYYQTISGSTVGGTSNTPYPDSEVLDMPLLEDDINTIKADAVAIATLNPVLCSLSADTIIGGGKLVCPLGFNTNGHDITLNGTLWVVGDITLRGDIILGSGYGSNSGVIIADDPDNQSTSGKILIENTVRVCGSAGCGINNDTYIMLLSTHSGIGTSYAVDVRNNADGAIVYSSNGTTFLKNNSSLKEVIAKKLVTSNNTDVYYETGLANVNFTSGPGGGWIVNDWNEIQ